MSDGEGEGNRTTIILVVFAAPSARRETKDDGEGKWCARTARTTSLSRIHSELSLERSGAGLCLPSCRRFQHEGPDGGWTGRTQQPVPWIGRSWHRTFDARRGPKGEERFDSNQDTVRCSPTISVTFDERCRHRMGMRWTSRNGIPIGPTLKILWLVGIKCNGQVDGPMRKFRRQRSFLF